MDAREVKMDMSESENINFKQLFNEILSDDQDVPISKLYQLSDLPQSEFDEFMNRWVTVSEDRRAQVARHMADISEENFIVDFSPFSRKFMSDQSTPVRLAALDMLWDNSSSTFINPIMNVMAKDESDEVRAAAAATLGHYLLMMQWGEINQQYEEKIAEALLEQLKEVFTPMLVRRAALESIASGSLAEIPDLIQQAYTSDDPQMRLSAVFAMGRSADDRWANQISNELDSDDPDMRVEASRAAGTLGQSDFTDQLIEIAKYDDHLEAQIAAIYALGQIGNDAATKALDDIANDEEYADLHEIADEAMEEMLVLGLDRDLPIIDWDGDESNDEFDDEDDDLIDDEF